MSCLIEELPAVFNDGPEEESHVRKEFEIFVVPVVEPALLIVPVKAVKIDALAGAARIVPHHVMQ